MKCARCGNKDASKSTLKLCIPCYKQFRKIGKTAKEYWVH